MREALWEYKREPAGMGEWCYRVYRNGVYWFYLEDSNQAMIVVNALNRDADKSDAVLELKILETKLSECQKGRETLRFAIAQATVDIDKITKEMRDLRQQEREQR